MDTYRRRGSMQRGKGFKELYHAFGLDSSRKGNLQYVEGDDEPSLMFLAGNSLVFVGLSSVTRRYLFSIGGHGLGSFVVHPSHNYLAVGETGNSPNVFVYTYPELHVFKTLKNGAIRSFSCMSFSPSGEKLATVSSSPDFLLTIWDWAEERMLLHSKVSCQN